MWKKVLGSLLATLLSGTVLAAERGVFPPVGVGARPLGMGGAFVAVADSADAVYWNPAGVNQLYERQLSTMQTALFGMEIGYHWLSLVQPLGDWTVGLGYSSLDASQAFGEFPYREGSYLLTLAHSLKNLHGGINLKYNYYEGGSTLVSSKARGVGLDVGLLWQRLPLSAGVVVRDFYTKLTGKLVEDGQEEATETVLEPDVAVGVAYKAGKTTWAFDLSELTGGVKPHLGVEYQVNGALNVRGGYSAGSFTAGLGLRTGNWLVDYAYNTHEAGDAQRFTLGIRF